MRDRIEHLGALRDDTLPEADVGAELWGRNKRQRPEAAQKPDMLTKHKSAGRRKR